MRLLLVSYYAPPHPLVASFRPIQLSKHLPPHGWSCSVLTATRGSYRSLGVRLDPDLESQMPAITLRAPGLDMLRFAKRANVPADHGALPVDVARTDARRPSVGSLARRLVGWIGSVIFSPDRHITWLVPAVVRGLRSSKHADLIYAQGPPFTNHMVGVVLKKLTGTPLVIMFEDPWMGMSHRRWRSAAQRRFQAWQEQLVAAHADRIFAGTDGFRDDLRSRLSSELAAKVTTVRMGADFNPRAGSPADNHDRFELLYAGSLRESKQYHAEGLFHAVAWLIANRPQIAERLRVTVYGHISAEYRDLARRLGIETVVDFRGPTSHDAALAAMASADALLLIIGDDRESLRWYTSGKIYEYMAARRPIFGLVPEDGEAATLIREHNLGTVCSPSSEGAIAGALVDLVTRGRVDAGELGNPSRYLSSEIAREMAAHFSEVIHRSAC